MRPAPLFFVLTYEHLNLKCKIWGRGLEIAQARLHMAAIQYHMENIGGTTLVLSLHTTTLHL